MRILKFYADWCAPCKALTTVLDQNNISVDSVNIELEPTLTIKHNIRKVPTMVFVDDEGNEVDKIHGMATAEQIKAKINEHTRDSGMEQEA